MKITLILSLFLTSFLSAVELLPKDIHGIWKIELGPEVKEEGFTIKSEIISYLLEDGSCYEEALFNIYLDEADTKILTYGGIETASWTIKDGKLISKTVKSADNILFSSLDPAVLKEVMAVMKEDEDDESSYSLVSKTADKLVFKDDEGESTLIYTRCTDEKYQSLLALKNKKDLEPLLKSPDKLEKEERPLVDLQLRRFSRSVLKTEGFRSAPHLPTFSQRSEETMTLRPRREILDRLFCNYVVSFWITMPEEQLPSKKLKTLIEKLGLTEKLTQKEKDILAMSRKDANARHMDGVGWKMENMFALAWILGMEMCPEVNDAQAGDAVAGALIPFITKELQSLVGGKPLKFTRSPLEVIQLEDIFYCAHNAVRSAQTRAKNTVPKGFHPILNGGVISEKRHALTWALSPKVKWEDTDLST